MSSTDNAVFSIGDPVVYPLQGVGCILGREKRREKEYYRVQITASDMDVLLPVDNASALGLRHLATATEARKAISSLSEKRESRAMDWKQRLLMNQELMKEEAAVEQSPMELLGQFFSQQNNQEMSPEQTEYARTLMETIRKEEGVE